MMRHVIKMAATMAVIGMVGVMGTVRAQEETAYPAGLWAKPISNPVYTDVAFQKREVNFIYVYHTLPSHLDTTVGNLALDGDLWAVAIQAEIPICEGLSFVADKSGWIDFNPENGLVFDSNEGMVNLAGGLKWSFFQNDLVTAALRGTVEFPVGDTEVFQGNGRGSASPALLLTHLAPCYAVNGVVGATIPFDSSELSTMGYASLATAYRVTEKMTCHVELNWFRVLEAGRGESDLNDLGKETLNIAEFEGGDLINMGASDSEKHPDFVSVALGARYQITDTINLGVAYEVPVSTHDRGLMDERVTVDLGMTF
ncbi:MAG: hypothetical protein K9N51_11540 [Candidatus Pacebacteria bacterium]|nr:hypothetical protein [Candidatus Paceibacterota bacterium]